MKYKGLLYSCAAILSLWSSFVAANASAWGESNGSILFLKEPNIRMDSEKLRISNDLVEVQYVFTNPTSNDVNIPIAFPMPANIYEEFVDTSEVLNFQVFVNGFSQQFEQRTVILLDRKKDITQQMEALGWDLEAVETLLSQFYYAQIVPNKEERKNLPDDWFDANGRIRFTVHEYYLWNQNFPANTSINISHMYSPSRTAGIPDDWVYLSSFIRADDYCMSEAEHKTYLKGTGNFFWSKLKYVLQTGANWNGPIRDFHLIIEKPLPEAKVYLCFDGKLEKTSAQTLEFRAKNYTPKQDLNLLFLRPLYQSYY